MLYPFKQRPREKNFSTKGAPARPVRGAHDEEKGVPRVVQDHNLLGVAWISDNNLSFVRGEIGMTTCFKQRGVRDNQLFWARSKKGKSKRPGSGE